MNLQTFLDKYNRLLPQLYRVAFALVGNREDAEDAVQDAFMKVWEHQERLEQVANVEAYFVTSVRHVCLNQLRARHEEMDVDAQYALPDENDRTGHVSIGRSVVARLFDLLSPKARRIMVLRHIGEYSTRDIARITGETESNVRSTLSRARQQLRATVEHSSDFTS